MVNTINCRPGKRNRETAVAIGRSTITRPCRTSHSKCQGKYCRGVYERPTHKKKESGL
jgi:hypothetical protein